MKLSCTLFFLLWISFGQAQLSDTSCVKYRWIAFPANLYQKVFEGKQSGMNKSHFWDELKYMVVIKDLPIYDCSYDFSRNCNPILDFRYPSNITKVTDWANYTSTITSRFEKLVVDPFPLQSIDGGDSVRLMEDQMTFEVVYGPPSRKALEWEEITEIRVLEELKQDGSGYELVRVGLFSNYQELFWFSIYDIANVSRLYTASSWWHFFYEHQYTGWQYKQVSCYELRFR